MKIEITCTEFGIYSGAVFYGDHAVGTIQLNSSVCPKRVGRTIRRLRKLGVVVDFPGWHRSQP